MAFKLSLLAEAEREYSEAVEWYKDQSADVADCFLIELANALEALEVEPALFGFYATPYRRILLKSFPYKVVYEIDGDKVIVYAIYPTSRNDAELRNRLP